MKPVEVARGTSPVILCFPHVGTDIPPAIRARLNDNGRLVADTDWHLDRLYDGLLPGATTVRATFHRYVVDANRDPADTSLYPGQKTTTLVPTTDFDGRPIWQDGQEPTAGEIAARLTGYHVPYHAALAAEVERVKSVHGLTVLYDCHSIRSRIPFLFDGTLPDFNVGTNDGQTCSPVIGWSALNGARAADGFTHVLNGRFKGGWTTRHYGQPKMGVHAIQMELAQSTYLAAEAPPFTYDPARSGTLRPHLQAILQHIEQTAYRLKRGELPS